MATLYETLMANEAVECVHPKFIGVLNGKKDFIAEVKDGEVYLTDFGREFVEASKPDEVSKKPAASKKQSKEVQSANALASDENLEI